LGCKTLFSLFFLRASGGTDRDRVAILNRDMPTGSVWKLEWIVTPGSPSCADVRTSIMEEMELIICKAGQAADARGNERQSCPGASTVESAEPQASERS